MWNSLVLVVACAAIFTESVECASVNTITPTNCKPVQKLGNGDGCCDGSINPPYYGVPCDGDLTYPLCSPPQILDQFSPLGGIFGGSVQVPVSIDVCYKPSGCLISKWQYVFYCCTCPSGYTYVPGESGCSEEQIPGWCAQCSDPSEVLNVGGSLANTTCDADPCKGLTTINSPILTGNQVVISDNFKNDMQYLIGCAAKQNAKLYVVSTSRSCKPHSSPFAVDNSDHELGMATDALPQFPGQTSPVTRDQMDAAWCAYNMNVQDPCKLKYGVHPPPQNAFNKQINDFLVCAQGDSGLQLGVKFKGKNPDGTFAQDGNHFQRGSYSAAAKDAYQKLLKAYCNSKCPQVPVGNAGACACKCPC